MARKCKVKIEKLDKERKKGRKKVNKKNSSNTWILSAIMTVQRRKMKGETQKEEVAGLLLRSMTMGSSRKTEI